MFDINKIRQDFPILQQTINQHPLVYLDNSATTQKPRQVINSITAFYTHQNANIHRSAHHLSEQLSTTYESVRTKVQQFINASHPEEIIFTPGTTASINLIAHSYADTNLKPGDNIIITEMEHHSNIVPWQQLCTRKNASLKILPINDNGTLKTDQLPTMITKNTKLIALTHVSNVLGTINPIKKIITTAHANNIPVLIDGAQAIPHLPVDVQNLDCDFYVFSGHKLYAETGLGILYAKKTLLETMSPYQYGGGMIQNVTFNHTTFADPPHKFEAGTSNISAVISLGTALDYLTTIGITNIQHHEHTLTQYTLKQLSTLNDITIYGNPPNRCSIIPFNLNNIHHYDAVTILDKMGIALRSGTHCADPLMKHYSIPGCLRASLAFYNTKQDIDQLIIGLQKVQELYTKP